MIRAALAWCAALSATTASADYLCETTSGEITYVISETAQTVSLNEGEALPFRMMVRPLQALNGRVTAQVGIPAPARHGGYWYIGTMTMQFDDAGNARLFDSFSSFTGDTSLAFAMVDTILETQSGIPCQYAP